ncbi:MAG: periplasmic binding protein [Planctomycetaceae bacterium]|nr:periplasmic binding protein [Planctomycetaceae bacterium]
MQRIVSLLSSATEIACALGVESWLVGRSHECDFPASIRNLPQCSRPLINIVGNSREIDTRVKASARQGLSLYDVDGEMLRSLRPDVILTQTQCEVCAVSLKDVEAALCDMLNCQAQIVSLQPNSLSDFFRDIRLVATALQIPERGETLVGQLQGRFQAIQERVKSCLTKPTVACLEWLDPLMAAGNWVPELVEIAGGVNLFGTAGEHSPWMDWDELIEADPEIIIALPCGWDIEKATLELNSITQHPAWKSLRAVQSNSVFVTDGNQYFNRPGPRLVESAEILAEIFHPEVYSSQHTSTGWQRYRSA